MTGPALILCVWLTPIEPLDVILVAMGEKPRVECVLNVIPVASCADLPAALRRLREQYPVVTGGCKK